MIGNYDRSLPEGFFRYIDPFFFDNKGNPTNEFAGKGDEETHKLPFLRFLYRNNI